MISSKKGAGVKKVAYIYGMGYSGSTLLDLVLGLHSRMVGFGELYAFFEERHADFAHDFCSCGHVLDDCEFWGRFHEEYMKVCERTYTEKYRMFLNHVNEVYGSETIVIDSSKVPRGRDNLIELRDELKDEIDLRVIYLLRDVRGFSLSARKYKKEDGLFYGNLMLLQANWWRRNVLLKRRLERTGLPSIQLGYEELCIETRKALQWICDFIGIAFEESMLGAPAESRSHVVYGNRMKNLASRTTSIQYDYTWMMEPDASRAYALLPFVAEWNSRNVFGNIPK